MAILPLVIAPDPRLEITSEPVSEVNSEIRKLMDDMLETMYKSNGIGLAAVQVGVHKRVLVMHINYGSSRYETNDNKDKQPTDGSTDNNDSDEGEIYYIVNPEIIEFDNVLSSYNEGCLSFPGQFAPVKRPKGVRVKYLDYYGKEKIINATGLLATCLQHEIDHLNGIVFVDHISMLKRNMIMKKMKKLHKHIL